MKRISNERGAVPIIAIALIALVVVVAGVAVYQSSRHKAVVDVSPSPSPSASVASSPSPTGSVAPSASPASDQALIEAVVKAQCEKDGGSYKSSNITIKSDAALGRC
jgi:hypothetical protein